MASRTKVIFGGIAAATVLRIMMAAAATHLLQIVGLTLLGGTLLFRNCSPTPSPPEAVAEFAATGGLWCRQTRPQASKSSGDGCPREG